MLVLTRKINQGIIISGNISVRVLGLTRGGRVKIGILAPAEVSVVREEVLAKHRADRGADGERQG